MAKPQLTNNLGEPQFVGTIDGVENMESKKKSQDYQKNHYHNPAKG